MKHTGHIEFWEAVDAGLWEPETFEILKKYCQKDKLFIDIGAWNGVCSLFASELGSICYAVEPDREAIGVLKQNVSLNPGIIHTIEACIAGMNGTVLLNTQQSFGNSMSSILHRGFANSSIEVDSLTLERFISNTGIEMQDVCLIKIDIEGGEIDLIKQAEPFLMEHRPTVYLSIHPFWFPNLNDDINTIADVIFRIYRVFDTSGTEYEQSHFLDAVNSGVHSFVLEV